MKETEKNRKPGFSLMAWSQGKESTEGASMQRYVGVAQVQVVGLCPNQTELSLLYNTEIEREPQYLGVIKVSTPEGEKEVQSARVEFVLRTVAEKCDGVDLIARMSYFLRRTPRRNGDGTKVQVIDKYGRTGWVTQEQCKNHEIPVYSNGKPANLDSDYRVAYTGEESLTDFLRTLLNIPSVMRYDNKTKEWSMVERPDECLARLDHIEDYFKGNFSELKEILKLQPNNRVKVLLGVKSTDDGKMYQDVFTEMTLRVSQTDYSKLDAALQDRKNNGAYPNTVFEVCELKPYTVEPTDLREEKTTTGDAPWDFN